MQEPVQEIQEIHENKEIQEKIMFVTSFYLTSLQSNYQKFNLIK